MTTDKKVCRRCLLEELGETEYLASVQKYRGGLPEKEKTPEAAYTQRLEACKACDQLVNATCMVCGCYVEMRAARRSSRCPATPTNWEVG